MNYQELSGTSAIIPLQKIIDFRSYKKNTDTDIQPQHQYHNSSQASVHIGIVAEIVKVNGKEPREKDPSGCAEQSARQLASHGVFPDRDKGIQPGKDKDQHPQGCQGAKVKKKGYSLGDHGKPFVDKPLQRTA